MAEVTDDLDVIFGEERIEIVLFGEVYEASRLTLGDFAKFRAWAKQRTLSTFLTAATNAGLDLTLFSKTVEELLSSGAKIRRDDNGEPIRDDKGEIIVESDPVVNAMGTEEGMRHILSLSIRHKHPDFDASILGRLELDSLSKLADVVTAISAPTIEGGDTPAGNPQVTDSES